MIDAGICVKFIEVHIVERVGLCGKIIISTSEVF
jgi:hypothetical protein